MAAKRCLDFDVVPDKFEDCGNRDGASSGSDVVEDSDKDPAYVPAVKKRKIETESNTKVMKMVALLIYDTYNGSSDPMSLMKKEPPDSFLENFTGCIPQKLDSARHTETTKLRDVMSCLPWIPPTYHKSYMKLQHVHND
ncbi:hypothetical protein PR048_015458 [Dryococelus australis]|uniref:Uncharacterized protein n=1 Tax=Dryococelus australis TaxID=614101 RepID=A0ABQ9HHA4_9NEOP|nr:hypothetical protein PR048_015458 [Dryococelus australis]